MLEKMRSFISEQLNCDESEINPETDFREDLGADSLDLYELVMTLEEEYSTPRIKSILSGFGVILPLEASNVNLFTKQDGEKKQVWMKFECSEDVKDEFVAQLNSRHSGLFNRVIETPKMMDCTPITWWSYSNTFHYYEFKDMCVAYDEILRNLYLYAAN